MIPAAYRRALGLRVGDEVVLQLHDDEVRLLTLDQVIAHAQQIVGRQVPAGRSLVNELIAERRLEAQRE
ncbi:MAG: AbrB/MazE/SpoVT family DNA-binding domain-containing protein [Chloroflexi bacterium]|nr:AbrB/MazE/SpoVT family DNA-binding domain-containing protein [Chloroflexota bacterium]